MKQLILLAIYISIYQSKVYSDKSVVECAYDAGESDTLVVPNKYLESQIVEDWVLAVCAPKGK